MSKQNLVSAVLTPEQKTAILDKAVSLKTDMGFLITLSPSEKKEYFKVGNAYLPFIDKAFDVVNAHPDMMPGIFDLEEFNNDYQLSKDLDEILRVLKEITESVEDTAFAVSNDAMKSALEIYGAVQNNKKKIPGMDTDAAEMGGFFKKTRRNKTD